MSKPILTAEQVEVIEKLLHSWHGDKSLVVAGHKCDQLRDINLDTLCRYLYARDTVEVEKTVDEQLKMVYNSPKTIAGTFIEDGPKIPAFRLGMETALRIIGRQTPGVITWEE